MLALGIVLLIIGVVLVALGAVGPSPAPQLAPIGWLLVIVGLILALVAVLVVDGDVKIGALAGGLAMAAVPPLRGHSHAVALDQDPPQPVAGSRSDREPVVVAFIVGAVPLVIAAVTAIADLFAGVPNWIVPLATIIGTLTTGLAALWARARVTPVAAPKLDEGTPLVPMIEGEHT